MTTNVSTQDLFDYNVICHDFPIPNWQEYGPICLDVNRDARHWQKIWSNKTGTHFMKFMAEANVKKFFPTLIEYFNDLGKPMKHLCLFGHPPNNDPASGIHVDAYPPADGKVTVNWLDTIYVINFSVDNDENSSLIFFDQHKKEMFRRNYSTVPLRFRTDVFHSVINWSDKPRITASIRFYESSALY